MDINEITKLISKYHYIGESLKKRKEAIKYGSVQDNITIELQIDTNQSFLNDLMQLAGKFL